MHPTNEANTLDARLHALRVEWAEQTQSLYWSIRDLGGEPAALLGANPFCPPQGRDGVPTFAAGARLREKGIRV